MSAINTSIFIRVGGTESIGIEGYHETVIPRRQSPLSAFMVDGSSTLSLRMRRGELLDQVMQSPIFDSLGLWKVYVLDGMHVFVMQVEAFPNPYAVASVDFNSMRGEIVVGKAIDRHVDPVEHPLCGILFSKLIADRQGVIVHGCGLDLDGRGVLFVGTSGAGKSTLAGLFSSVPHVRILSDERTVVCMEDNRLMMYGTPWPGTAGLALPISVPLERIFFLRHAGCNRIDPVNRLYATMEMASSSFLPYWDRCSSERALGFIDRIIRCVPMSILGFLPNVSVVDFVWNVHDKRSF